MERAAKPTCRRGAEKPRVRPVRFELYGEEIVEKQVAASGKSGRVYLPVEWLGKRVKIIRVN
ncbi:MAG: DUF2080 family transposase-associated protein [Desulfarculaceae bacterium]|nr:DUF2080 family transposase-associated protein [Desulfarculaceae bacterium]